MQPNMKNNQLSKEEIEGVLNKAVSGVISTNGADGFPYGTPINFIYMNGEIFFHGRRIGEKMDNIKRDPKVCFTVYDEKGFEDCGELACDTTTVYDCVIIRGEAYSIDDVETKKKILLATVDKLAPGKTGMDDKKVPPTGVYGIKISSVTGKYHRAMAGHNIRN